MVYVDLSDFNETWPTCSSDNNAPKGVRLLRKSEYFFLWRPKMNDSSENVFYRPNLKKEIFYATNRNIEKPHFVNPSSPEWYRQVQFVWMSAVTQRLARMVFFAF